VALIGVVALSSTIYQFCYYIQEYTAQGYSTSLVVKSFLRHSLSQALRIHWLFTAEFSLILFTARKIYIKIFDGDNYEKKTDAKEKINIENAEPKETEVNEAEIKENRSKRGRNKRKQK
jgi:HD-like signal output (HDOD) protein